LLGGVETISLGDMMDRLPGSPARGDLLVLFHRNPGLIDTVDGVARRIGRTGISIENDVKQLTSLGVLRTKKIGTLEVLFLDRAKDKEILELVAGQVRSMGTSST
jgi:hypothetical protein